mgnify:FL=1
MNKIEEQKIREYIRWGFCELSRKPKLNPKASFGGRDQFNVMYRHDFIAFHEAMAENNVGYATNDVEFDEYFYKQKKWIDELKRFSNSIYIVTIDCGCCRFQINGGKVLTIFYNE